MSSERETVRAVRWWVAAAAISAQLAESLYALLFGLPIALLFVCLGVVGGLTAWPRSGGVSLEALGVGAAGVGFAALGGAMLRAWVLDLGRLRAWLRQGAPLTVTVEGPVTALRLEPRWRADEYGEEPFVSVGQHGWFVPRDVFTQLRVGERIRVKATWHRGFVLEVARLPG